MLKQHDQSVMRVMYRVLYVISVCAAVLVFLSSCSANLPVQSEAKLTEETALATKYSIVCIIHGDGDYLYHDTNGNEYKADEEALSKVKKIALQNRNAEVFIFHRKQKKNLLFFFPLKDGDFYYYRNGRLIENEPYWRDQEQSNFDNEVEFYRRFRADDQLEKVSVFLYFGHEIPEIGGTGYDLSYPNRSFTIHNLAGGLKELTRDSTKFDLLILSTCFGGSPYTVGTLGAFARYIIASPENLHLSYFDLHLLEGLDHSLRKGDVLSFANRFAQQAFERLTMDVQTAVSVAVYDVDRVQKYLNSVRIIYEREFLALQTEKISVAKIERCDCADLPAYTLPTINEGVNVFYRPARFGRAKLKQNHSGWECRKKN